LGFKVSGSFKRGKKLGMRNLIVKTKSKKRSQATTKVLMTVHQWTISGKLSCTRKFTCTKTKPLKEKCDKRHVHRKTLSTK